MSYAALRFVHITDAQIDRPLHCVGRLEMADRETLEDATLTAFRRAIDSALSRKVDFVLLTGETFNESDASLRARVALVDGLRRLEERGVPVFVVPGAAASADAWLSIPSLPENVSVFRDSAETLPLMRDGHAVAYLVAGTATALTECEIVPSHSSTANANGNGKLRPTPARIAVLTDVVTDAPPLDARFLRPSWSRRPLSSDPVPTDTFEFVVFASSPPVAAESLPTPFGPVMVPPVPQSTRPDELRSDGVTLVEITAHGRVHRSVLPTASVRYVSVELDVEPQTSRDDLVGATAAALAHPPVATGEKLRLVKWTVHGDGPVFDLLADETNRQDLLDEAYLTAEILDEPRRCHEFHLHRRLPPNEDDLCIRFAAAFEASSTPSGTDLTRQLTAQLSQTPDDWHMDADGLVELIGELDAIEIMTTAREMGTAWLQQVAPGEREV